MWIGLLVFNLIKDAGAAGAGVDSQSTAEKKLAS